MKRRKGTPLSLYYLSVTGLLGSCYGYRDSRLSVLLTIAHKGGIQLWATMPISLFLSLALFLSTFPSFYISLHLLLNIFPSHFLPFPVRLSNFTHSNPTASPPPPHPTTASFFCLVFLSILLSLTLPYSFSTPLPLSPWEINYPNPDCEMSFSKPCQPSRNGPNTSQRV